MGVCVCGLPVARLIVAATLSLATKQPIFIVLHIERLYGEFLEEKDSYDSNL